MREIEKANFKGSNFEQLLNSIFDKVYDESIAMKHEYDLEIKNSMEEQEKGDGIRRFQMKLKN